MSEKYNGWTNYATWRVKLELFDDISDYEEEVSADELKDRCDEILTNFGEINSGLALDYAWAFLEEVNWDEIAESLNEDIRENNKDE